jgi:hypothetical protein
MEQSNSGFVLPEATKREMANLAKWARYIAVSGFIIGGIIILFGVFTGLITLGLFHLGIDNEVLANLPSWIIIFGYIVIVGVYFIPFLLLYNFAVRARAAIVLNSEKMLNSALSNLYQCFRFVGVITVTFISLYVLLRIGVGIAFILGLL